MSTLVEILSDKPTDKVASGLASFYDRLFTSMRYDFMRMLEIGVDKGGSIRGWLEFFPNTIVYGIDCRQDALNKCRADIKANGGVTRKDAGCWLIYADITDQGYIEQLFNDVYFDIIIDDGSHINTDVFAAFEVLWDHLNPAGYYVVEDISVPYRHPDYPAIAPYFINFAVEEDLKDAYFGANVLYLRKP